MNERPEKDPLHPSSSGDGLAGRGAAGQTSPEDFEERFESVAESYAEALRDGETLDEDALLEAHPEMAVQLKRRLKVLRFLHDAAVSTTITLHAKSWL